MLINRIAQFKKYVISGIRGCRQQRGGNVHSNLYYFTNKNLHASPKDESSSHMLDVNAAAFRLLC